MSFDVFDEIDLGNLTEVKPQKVLIPPTANVLFNINKATYRNTPDGSLRFLSLSLRIVEGIGDEGKFANKMMFHDMFCWANKEVRVKPYFQTDQHLVELTRLLKAVNMDLSSVKLNDDLLNSLIGQDVRANITQRPIQQKNPETGDYEDTEEDENKLNNWTAA